MFPRDCRDRGVVRSRRRFGQDCARFPASIISLDVDVDSGDKSRRDSEDGVFTASQGGAKLRNSQGGIPPLSHQRDVGCEPRRSLLPLREKGWG